VARFTKRVRHPLRPPHRRRARQWTERTQPRRLQEREGEGEREEGVSDTRGSKRHSSSRWKEMGDSPPKTATRIHPKIGSLIPKGSLVPSPFNLLSTRAKAGEAVSVAAPTTAAASILGSSFLNTFFASANLSGLATADDEIDCIREKREKESERAREREQRGVSVQALRRSRRFFLSHRKKRHALARPTSYDPYDRSNLECSLRKKKMVFFFSFQFVFVFVFVLPLATVACLLTEHAVVCLTQAVVLVVMVHLAIILSSVVVVVVKAVVDRSRSLSLSLSLSLSVSP